MAERLTGRFAVVVLFCFILTTVTACGLLPDPFGVSSKTPALPKINVNGVLSRDEICTKLVESQIEAWRSENPDALKKIYTEDIVHFDGSPAYVGIDEVTHMAENMWIYFSKWEMKAGEAYISKNACVGEWMNWNIMGFSQDEPAIEYDLLNYRGDKISFWRLFYDNNFQEAFGAPERIDDDFLTQFASTWSGGKKKQIGNLYSENAVYEDTLFDISLSGRSAISDFASSFAGQFQDAAWELMSPFGEEEAGYDFIDEFPFPSQGGVFSISIPGEGNESCEIMALIILTPNDENLITQQRMFYDAQSLISCGLAE